MRRLARAFTLGIGAALPFGPHAAERPVAPAASGPNRLTLDATLLAGAQPFRVSEVTAAEGRAAVATGGAGDLRLYDAANREVPYLLVMPRVEAQWRGARVLRVAPTKLTRGFEADLEALLPINGFPGRGVAPPLLHPVRPG